MFPMLRLTPYAKAFSNLFFPANCHICSGPLPGTAGAFDENLCMECFSSIKRCSPVACSLCGKPLKENKEKETCPDCLRNPPAHERLVSCYAYDGALRRLIHIYKYENRPYLASTISRLILKAVPEGWLNEFDALVYIPLHPARQREREYNQAELALRQLSISSGKKVVPLLKRKKNTRPLSQLAKKDRLKALDNAFCIDKKQISEVRGKRVLLFDDIVTTASTARLASAIIKKEAGCSEINFLTFARG